MNDLSASAGAYVLLTSQNRGWRDLEAELRRIPAGPTRVVGTLWHRLGVHYGASVHAACRCEGHAHRRVQSHGDADFVPAGLDGEWEDDADCSVLRISLSPALLDRAAEDLNLDPGAMTFAPRFQMRDPGVEHIAWALKGELERKDPSDRLYVDSLATALAARLMRLLPQGGKALRRTQHGLSPRRRRQVVDFIEAHLHDDLRLSDIARIAGVGATQLKASFPRALGLTVHQYVLRRRVERAKSLLLAGETSPAQVALAAGFAHQSHMALCMRRILGVTPRQIVASRR
jgi:AraC family transcriptional regulator